MPTTRIIPIIPLLRRDALCRKLPALATDPDPNTPSKHDTTKTPITRSRTSTMIGFASPRPSNGFDIPFVKLDRPREPLAASAFCAESASPARDNNALFVFNFILKPSCKRI